MGSDWPGTINPPSTIRRLVPTRGNKQALASPGLCSLGMQRVTGRERDLLLFPKVMFWFCWSRAMNEGLLAGKETALQGDVSAWAKVAGHCCSVARWGNVHLPSDLIT